VVAQWVKQLHQTKTNGLSATRHPTSDPAPPITPQFSLNSARQLSSYDPQRAQIQAEAKAKAEPEERPVDFELEASDSYSERSPPPSQEKIELDLAEKYGKGLIPFAKKMRIRWVSTGTMDALLRRRLVLQNWHAAVANEDLVGPNGAGVNIVSTTSRFQ